MLNLSIAVGAIILFLAIKTYFSASLLAVCRNTTSGVIDGVEKSSEPDVPFGI